MRRTARLSNCTPASDNFADLNCLKQFAERYGTDVDDICHKMHQAKRLLDRMLSGDRPTILVGFVSQIEPYREAFPELHRLGLIAMALPVSTAS